MLSYMYTFPEHRRQGHMAKLLNFITQHYRLHAVPINLNAEEVLQKCGFKVDSQYFGNPFYRSY